MKAEIQDLKNTFEIGYHDYRFSREESEVVWNLYHNRQYTKEQEYILSDRGQPKETFNVIKMFARLLVGYYSTVVNTAKIMPANPRNIITATVLNDTINSIYEKNRFDVIGDNIKLGGLISGVLSSFVEVIDTGKKDQFGRILYNTKLSYVPDYELVLDPDSVEDDYSDAEYLHRFKWYKGSDVRKRWGKKTTDKLAEHHNFTPAVEADKYYTENINNNYNSTNRSTGYFNGTYRYYDSYLVVHSVVEDENGDRWSCFWHDEVMIEKSKITYKETKWPYRVHKLHSSNRKEYYGIFREIIQSQLAINQALLQIQLMANSTKVIVETEALDNMTIEEFTVIVNRVNSVIPIKDLQGIKIENMSKEIKDQYVIIDNALNRIKMVLGVNDSFLGMAFASDSGRKVKLQQNQSIMSLRYITSRIKSFYELLTEDITNLVKQYYRANQYLAITDNLTGVRWLELNKPMTYFTGQYDQQGQPVYEPILLEVIDPATGEPKEDKQGNILLAPVSEENTDFEFTEYDITFETTAFNDEDEKGQLMLESVMSGQIGTMVSQVNPAGFFKIASLALKTMGTRYSPEIADILDQTAASLGNNQNAAQQASYMAQNNSGNRSNGRSQSLKLPQNTNEGN